MVRNCFRDRLRKLGCGMLQASVWITLYDPHEILRKIIRYDHLESEVLVSSRGEGIATLPVSTSKSLCAGFIISID